MSPCQASDGGGLLWLYDYFYFLLETWSVSLPVLDEHISCSMCCRWRCLGGIEHSRCLGPRPKPS